MFSRYQGGLENKLPQFQWYRLTGIGWETGNWEITQKRNHEDNNIDSNKGVSFDKTCQKKYFQNKYHISWGVNLIQFKGIFFLHNWNYLYLNTNMDVIL